MNTYMFPGQGSQSRGMGEGLFDEFSDITQKADNILGYSIKELCLDDPRRELNKTLFTQPALYVVNALSYYKKLKETGVEPDFAVGHSLGEFNALLAAGCYDFEAGLKLVKKRGELMSQATKGGMAAILNASKEFIENTLQENGLNNIDLANYNTPTQIVIAGPTNEIAEAQQYFEHGDLRYYPLNTGGAFHSRFMHPSSDKFLTYLKKFKFSELKIPVVSNVTAKPYNDSDVVDNLSNQMQTGVRWSESIQYLMELASDNGAVMEFEEIGNGDVLTKILATIKSDLATLSKNQSEAISAPEVDTPVKAGQNGVINETPYEDQSAKEKVESWNRTYPVGTKVKSITMDYDELETRTQAVLLFGFRPAVYMKDYNGYFDLNELAPI